MKTAITRAALALFTAFAVLASPVSADDVKIVVNLTKKTIKTTGVLAIRETVPVEVWGAGTQSASALVMRVVRDGTTYAINQSFSSSTSSIYTCDLDLNTDELVDFFDGMSEQASRTFDLGLWNTSTARLLINDDIELMNNPYNDSMPGPSPIGVQYVQFFQSNSVWWAVGASNGTNIGMLPVVAFSTNHFTDGAYLCFDAYEGFFLQTNGVLGSGASDNDPLQGGRHSPVGTNKYIAFESAYTGGPPAVVMQSSSDFTYEARPYPTSIASNGFFYAIGSGAGLVTNAWDVYWLSAPTNAVAVGGGGSVTDSRIINVVSAHYGTIIDYDQGTNGATEIPNWGQITQYVSTAGITETDPAWVAASGGYYTVTQADALFATGTPLYAESGWLSASGDYYTASQSDALFATGTPLYVESGGGDTYLASNNVFTGAKQTMDELMADSVTISNANLVVNGTFDSSASWTKDGEWAIAGGSATVITGATFTIIELYQDIDATDHTYTVTFDLSMVGIGVYVVVDLRRASDGAYAEGGANIFVASGSYEVEITGVSGYEQVCVSVITVLGMTPVSVDNIVVIDQQKAFSLTQGQINLGGEVLDYDRMQDWDAKVDSESDPIWMATQATVHASMDLANTALQPTGNANGLTNFPALLVKTSATDVTFPYWRFLVAPPGYGVLFQPIGGRFSVRDKSGPLALDIDSDYRRLHGTNGQCQTTFAHGLRVGPDDGTNLAVYASLTNLYATKLTANGGNAGGLINVQPFSAAWRIAYSGAGGLWKEKVLGGAGQLLRSTGTSSAPDWWTPTFSVTATNVALVDLEDTFATNCFVIGDGAHLIQTNLAAVQSLLGIGQATNIQFSDMQMAGDTNEVVYYTGTKWTNANIVTVLLAEQTVMGGTVTGLDADTIDGTDSASLITILSSINDLADVDTTGVATGSILGWDGAEWVVTNDASATVDTNALQLLWVAADSNLSNSVVGVFGTATGVLWTAVTQLVYTTSNGLDGAWNTDITTATQLVWTATTTEVASATNTLKAYIDAQDTNVRTSVTALAAQYDTAWVINQLGLIEDTSNAFVAADAVVSNGVVGYVDAQDTIISNALVAADSTLSNTLNTAIGLKATKTGDLDQFTALGGTTGQVWKTHGDGTGSWQADSDSWATPLTCLVQAFGTAVETVTAVHDYTATPLAMTETIDLGGDFNDATDTFVAPATGLYRFSASVPVQGVGHTVDWAYVGVYNTNTASVLYSDQVGLNKYLTYNVESYFHSLTFTVVLSLSASDPVTLIAWTATGDSFYTEYNAARQCKASLLIERIN